MLDGNFGAVRSASFQRLTSRPVWSPEFYGDYGRSGGALIDLHIHDTDFVRWCFGEPDSVDTAGGLDHMTTLYRYPSGPSHVVAEGGWDPTPGFEFRMRFVVVFEHGDMRAPFVIGQIYDGTQRPQNCSEEDGACSCAKRWDE